MTIGVKKVARPREMSFSESLYLVEIVKGLGVTMGHLLSNIVHQEGIKTIEYPEVRREMPPRFRGCHRLMKRADGTPRCVACYCCATACPAKCITIVAGESPDPAVEKYPVRFDIDMLRTMGATIRVDGEKLVVSADRLRGAELDLIVVRSDLHVKLDLLDLDHVHALAGRLLVFLLRVPELAEIHQPGHRRGGI